MNRRFLHWIGAAIIASSCARPHYQVFQWKQESIPPASPLRFEYDYWPEGRLHITVHNEGREGWILRLDQSAVQIDSVVWPLASVLQVPATALPLPGHTTAPLQLADHWTPHLSVPLARSAPMKVSAEAFPSRRLSFYFRVCPMSADSECRWEEHRFALSEAYLVPPPVFSGKVRASMEGRHVSLYPEDPWRDPLRSYRYHRPKGHWLRTFVPSLVGVFGLIFISLAF